MWGWLLIHQTSDNEQQRLTVPAEPEPSATLKLSTPHIQPNEHNMTSSSFLDVLQRLVSIFIVPFTVWEVFLAIASSPVFAICCPSFSVGALTSNSLINISKQCLLAPWTLQETACAEMLSISLFWFLSLMKKKKKKQNKTKPTTQNITVLTFWPSHTICCLLWSLGYFS